MYSEAVAMPNKTVGKDKNAPIFNYCDYGIVGDIYKVLPELTKALS